MAPTLYEPKAANRSKGGPLPTGQYDGDLHELLGFKAKNDLGNSERFIARFGENFRYVPEMGWLVWDGKRWNAEDGEASAQIKAQETSSAIRQEARAMEQIKETSNEDINQHFAWARRSGESGKIACMQKEAKPHLMVKTEKLDSHPYLFNADNVTLELGKKVIARQHRREDLITRVSPVVYDPAADCPIFRETIDTILPDRDVQEFIRVWSGYGLTGDISEQELIIYYGQGRNGKSTLMDVLSHIMGDYALTLPFTSLLHNDRKGGGDATPDLAELPGARGVTAAEPDAGARFSESMLKTMTGGEKMKARHLNKGFFEFTPQFKLTLAFNNRPSVRDGSDAIWRRINMVPFDVQIPEDEVDKHLKSKLMEEAPGILNWMIGGAEEWFKSGLVAPNVVRAATQDYRADSDPIGNFLNEMTVPVEGVKVRAKVLHEIYEKWCKASAVEPVNNNRFGRTLRDKGLKKETVGVVWYFDIEINQPALENLEAASGQRNNGGNTSDK